MRRLFARQKDDQVPAEEVFTFADRIHLVNLVNDRLYLMATTDALTGLRNRRSFLDTLESELERCTRGRLPLSLMIVDADNFKAINDTHGHETGDEVLRVLAQAFLEEMPRPEGIARLGGEEFGIQLAELALPQARALCERLMTRVRTAKVRSGRSRVGCTVSIGLTEADETGDSVGALMKRADQALYRAKQHGRNRVEVA